MKRIFIALVAPFLIASCACCGNSGATTTTYVCQCGKDCPKCKTTSDQPGTCACGKPLVAR